MRRALKTLMWIVIVVMMIPVLLYVPPIQRLVKDIALEKVAEATGMKIEIERFLLRFPLEINLGGVTVIEATGDTMVVASDATVDVDFLPLLRGDVAVSDVSLADARYKLGTPDSALFLVAKVNRFLLDEAAISLLGSSISVGKARLDGGDVELVLQNDTASAPVDTVASAPWLIKAQDIELRNITYRMKMLPTIDSLRAHLAVARLQSGVVDMATHKIHAALVETDTVTAAYFTPTAEVVASYPVIAPAEPTASGEPWSITADRVRLLSASGVYAMSGAVPVDGLDMNYLSASNINIEVDSFYNRAVEIRVPLSRLTARERCGVMLNANGLFEMDSVGLRASRFDISTLFSSLQFDAYMGMGDMTTDSSVPIRLDADGRVGLPDVEMIMPALKPLLANVPRHNDLRLNADIAGTIGSLDLRTLSASLPEYLELAIDGRVTDVMHVDRIGGNIEINGEIHNVDFVKPTLLEARLAEQISIPPTTLQGNVAMQSGAIDGSLQAITGTGRLALDGQWQGTAEDYDITMALDSFPVNSFMPTLGVGIITADLKAKGHGINPLAPGASVTADVIVNQLVYDRRLYSDIRAWAQLANKNVTAGIISLNDNANLDMELIGSIDGDDYSFEVEGDIRELNLRDMGFSTTRAEGSMALAGSGRVNPITGYYDVDMTVDGLEWHMDGVELTSEQIDISLDADSLHTKAKLQERDLSVDFVAMNSLDSLMSGFSNAFAELDRQMTAKAINVETFQRALPHFDLSVTGGSDNIATQYLQASDMSLRDLSLSAGNDSLLHLNGHLYGLRSGATRLDSIEFAASQSSRFLVYRAAIDNRRGTMDDFAHVRANGYVAGDKVAAFVIQRNIVDSIGFNIGVVASIADSVLNLKFSPNTPVIGYKKWNLNPDNFIDFNFVDKQMKADFRLTSAESYIKLFSQPIDSVQGRDEMRLQIDGVRIERLLAVSPVATPMKGVISADMGFRQFRNIVGGKGTLAIDEFYYDRKRVGSFLFDVGLATNNNGKMMARADLMIDSIKTLQLAGMVNDTIKSSPYKLDLSMIKFPLRVLNPFLPQDMAQFRGVLNGDIDISGNAERPILNGHLDFDSTAVNVGMMGSTFTFSEANIPINDNIILFDGFKIKAVNDNPLAINGTIDINDIVSPKINLDLAASDMQIVGSERSKKVDIYGKAFIDLAAKIKGDMSFMDIDAEVDLLGGTNVTYVMRDVQGVIARQNTGDMVRFMPFTDSIAMSEAVLDTVVASDVMAMNVDAILRVSDAAIVNVDITANGNDKAQVQGGGTFNYTMTSMGDSRFTGRYTIEKGFVRYTPPLMSEKYFNFTPGSYISFTGDLLNPILNIKAVDDMKVNVTQEGQNSRLVNFDVKADISGTLENMNVAFDLAAKDDISIANELQTMSAEQRANQAMNMLLYDTYTGPGSTASGNIIGNPLYSFLESQINAWAANNIKGVDISFGIDQYDNTKDGTKSSSTSYSYRVSKALFNDRFKIVVGGNYSTDADADENFSQNLINDISFEYMLNRSGSMYVKLFRHVGYESILEGEVIQTGVGFVYKRKLRSLRDLFGRSPKPQTEITKDETTD